MSFVPYAVSSGRQLRKSAVVCAVLAVAAVPAAAGSALTNIEFISNGGAFINNTIAEWFSSPLAFTSPSLGEPFLNNADSSITLGYGDYFAYAFAGYGQHVGVGTISGLKGGVSFSVAANFPADLGSAATFFSHTFADGDTLTVGTTGLSADRVRIFADGGGLLPDGVGDAVYSFSFAPIPEPVPAAMLLAGLAVLGLIRRRRG